MRKFIISVFFLVNFLTANAHPAQHFGKIKFITTGKQLAQPYFENGVLLLHSFLYEDARKAFQLAEKHDPNFALAYWGEAMTYNHTIWNEQNRKLALDALNKFAPTPKARISKAKGRKEKLLMHAIDTLYGPGKKIIRDNRYADIMEKIYRKYPDDDEVASFYALSLLGVSEGQRSEKTYMQAAAIADEIYSRNMMHPGALHYAIHAYDDPMHAPLGLRAARRYAQIAPDASHALHMPSHIYIALGLWDEVIKSNQAAWNASIKHNPLQNPKAYTIDDFHALQWLSYAYLQKCQFDKSLALVKKMQEITLKASSPMAKWYYTLMRAAYIIETKNYNSNLISFNLTGVELAARASNYYVEVINALNHSDLHTAQLVAQSLNNDLRKSGNGNDNYHDYFVSTSSTSVRLSKIIALEIKAQILAYQKKNPLKYLNAAVKIENKLSFAYGPPIPTVPAYELLGEYLLKMGRYKTAYTAFYMALNRNPARRVAKKQLFIIKHKLASEGISVPENLHPYFNKLMLPNYYH